MRKVVIFTDSTSDLTKELYEKYDIKVIPFLVNFGDDVYKDGIEIDVDKLEKLINDNKHKKIMPSTAAPGPDLYKMYFDEYLEKDYDILFVGIGDKLSSGYKNVSFVNTMIEKDRLFVVDSMNLSSGIGLQAINAAILRDSGKSAKEIYDELTKRAKNVFSNFSVFTFDYLKKGGRVTATKAFFATLFKIKPILGVREGLLKVRKLSKGKFINSLNFQIEELKFHVEHNNVLMDRVFITHFNSDAVDYFKEEIIKLGFKEDNILITKCGAVIGSHSGPGTLGLLYEVKDGTLEYIKEVE